MSHGERPAHVGGERGSSRARRTEPVHCGRQQFRHVGAWSADDDDPGARVSGIRPDHVAGQGEGAVNTQVTGYWLLAVEPSGCLSQRDAHPEGSNNQLPIPVTNCRFCCVCRPFDVDCAPALPNPMILHPTCTPLDARDAEGLRDPRRYWRLVQMSWEDVG
jgi:hypothetical protein